MVVQLAILLVIRSEINLMYKMTKPQLLSFNSFLLKQIKMIGTGKVKLVFRGDTLENLCFKLNVEYRGAQTDFEVLTDRLFMLGEKAKRYYLDDNSFEIDETNEFVFEKIADYFHSTLKNNNPNIRAFYNRNGLLSLYFSEKHNRIHFVGRLDSLKQDEQLLIRNYYLTLLHQLASIKYKNKSHFVSTSEDYEVAKKFASSRNAKQNKVVLHCWSPTQVQANIVRKYGLPTYSIGPYHYQKEISVLGGILPHFIACIESVDNGEIYPNPHIFSSEINNNTFLYGLDIDQRNFEDYFTSSNYTRSIVSNGNTMWEMP